jgi:hypothetical protein
MRSIAAMASISVRLASSFAMTTSAIVQAWRRQSASRSSAERNSNPTVDLVSSPSAAAPKRSIKPPPIENQISSVRHWPPASNASNRMALGWRSKIRYLSKVMSRSITKSSTRPFGSSRRRPDLMSSNLRLASSGSSVSGSCPSSPRTIALSVACPLPVQANEPKTVIDTWVVASLNRWANCAAAFIGPIVWDDDGPIPILKRSRTLGGRSTTVPSWRFERASKAIGRIDEDVFDMRHFQTHEATNAWPIRGFA